MAAARRPAEARVTLEDVAVRFSREEWRLVDEAQRRLYLRVMLENFALVSSLGCCCGVHHAEAPGEHGASVSVPQGQNPKAAAPSSRKRHPCERCTPVLRDVFRLVEPRAAPHGQRLLRCGACAKRFYFRVNCSPPGEPPVGEAPSALGADTASSGKSCSIHVSGKTFPNEQGERDFLSSMEKLQQLLTKSRQEPTNVAPRTAPRSNANRNASGERGQAFHPRHRDVHAAGSCFAPDERQKPLTHRPSFSRHRRARPGRSFHASGERGKFSRGSSALVQRPQTHAGAREATCSRCGKPFSLKPAASLRPRGRHVGEDGGEDGRLCRQCAQPPGLVPARVRRRPRGARPGSRPHRCEDCGRSFASAATLGYHRSAHTGKRPYVCGAACGKAYVTPGALRDHRRRCAHAGGRPHGCGECGKAFDSRWRLARHRRSHAGEKPYACRACGKPFTSSFALRCHEQGHLGARPYECGECGRAFTTSAGLRYHLGTHAGARPHACGECGKAFACRSACQAHRRAHSGERPHACGDCGKAFTRRSSLLCHRRAHTGERPHACGDCGKAFARVYALHCHRRLHTGERPYACGECGKAFPTSSGLGKHRRVHPGGASGDPFRPGHGQRAPHGERPFPCGQCGKSFPSGASLRYHQRAHAGERPYTCGECGKTFVYGAKLRYHQRAHAGERPYVCAECGKAFVYSAKLRYHQRVHAREKPYVCGECGKSFVYASTFRYHQRVHAGERPYVCAECGKAFIYGSKLRYHQRVHAAAAAAAAERP